ncbi:MAG: hypothetical protein PVG01_02055 [Desulfobacterales bacterium]
MADIIPIDDKLTQSREKKDAIVRKQKILAVRKVFQCTHCAFKCEKCGTQIDPAHSRIETESRKSKIPYRLCESCAEEYQEYVEWLKGRGDPASYWHNEAWFELWRKWIAYQEAIDRYLKSKEFLQLLQELKQKKPDR